MAVIVVLARAGVKPQPPKGQGRCQACTRRYGTDATNAFRRTSRYIARDGRGPLAFSPFLLSLDSSVRAS
jgi:hypothetical protein